MATIKGREKIHYHDDTFAPLTEECYLEWGFNNTSDILMIKQVQPEGSCAYGGASLPAREDKHYFGVGEAYAFLRALKEWEARQ